MDLVGDVDGASPSANTKARKMSTTVKKVQNKGGAPLPRGCRAQGGQQQAQCKSNQLRWRPWVKDQNPLR